MNVEGCSSEMKNIVSQIWAKKNVKKLLKRIFSIDILNIYELDLIKKISKITLPLILSFRFGNKEDLNSMDHGIYDYSNKEILYFNNRLDQGDRFLLAIHNGSIVGYVWIMKDCMELSVHNHISLSSNKSYIYKGFVLDEYRGNRILNGMDYFVIDLMRTEGKKFIITTVSIRNVASNKARRRIGFKIIGRIINFRLCGLKFDYISKKNRKYLQ
jgi:hypothetical protein